ncbi:MAG TPA: cysteine-rich CWC family protein [Pseudolabrys sp.]|nr:cysteine-rich CWC family protein [Pseudolabrys sp.]
MTTAPQPTRRLACARCGAAFDCGLGGECWCAAEPYRLPLTTAGASEDCLCPQCLRKAAVAAHDAGTASVPPLRHGTEHS